MIQGIVRCRPGGARAGPGERGRPGDAGRGRARARTAARARPSTGRCSTAERSGARSPSPGGSRPRTSPRRCAGCGRCWSTSRAGSSRRRAARIPSACGAFVAAVAAAGPDGRVSGPRARRRAGDPLRRTSAAASCPRPSSARSTSSRPRTCATATTWPSGPSWRACSTDYVGRPTPLYRARGLEQAYGRRAPLPQARGPLPHRRAQDQQRARPGAAGLDGWASGASSPRPAPASTAWPRPPPRRCWASSAASTWGAVDMARQRAQRDPHAHARRRGAPGRLGHRHAQGRAQRGHPRLGDQRAGRRTTSSGRRSGPAPYPEIVRRAPVGDRRRGARADAGRGGRACPATVVACVGGGSNAIGIFRAFLDDAEVALVGVEAGGEGIESGRHGASLGHGHARACCTARYSYLLQDADGQVTERTRSRPVSTTPAWARSTATCATPAAVRYESATDAEALAAFQACSRARGDHPGARELARAGAARRARGRGSAARSGAGLPVRPRATRTWTPSGPRSGSMTERRERHPGRLRRGRPAAVHALRHGRLPGPGDQRRARRAAGPPRRPDRARHPVLGPARRRPDDPGGRRSGPWSAGPGPTTSSRSPRAWPAARRSC